MTKSPAVEALKELLRVGLLAAIPLIIIGLQANMIDWRTIGVVAAIAVLRALDKLLHQMGKQGDDKTLLGGLTRF